MNRNQRILNELERLYETATKEELVHQQGASAQSLAQFLGLTRANVSAELNKLVRANQVLKIKTYPVRYLAKSSLAPFVSKMRLDQYQEVHDLTECMNDTQQSKVSLDPFQTIIGYNGSFKKSISQAKAAIHYPPMGLHMLLTGQTGAGKTFFAEKIYRYAVFAHILETDAPFVKFNCADYYHNPQLLMSHLFGHIKGAFTGAETESSGLIDQAHGGILLLDEVHRLPPEGQEMLFYFIDHGQFNRLGESGYTRKANVTIICATTETPNSVLLDTFQRRILMLIQIPNFSEKTIQERVELVKYLFEIEAFRLQRTLAIDSDVLHVLIHFVTNGNVGQLKSRVQLTCAQAFLHQLNEQEKTAINLEHLPDDAREFWRTHRHSLRQNQEAEYYIEIKTLIYPEKQQKVAEQESDPVNIYDVIQQKVTILEEEGFSERDIQQYILTDLHTYIRKVVQTSHLDYNLLKFVDPVISALTIRLKTIAEKELATRFDTRFLYYIGMHLDAFIHRKKEWVLSTPHETEKISIEKPLEYAVAQQFKQIIAQELKICLPEIEVVYLTLLIDSIHTLEDLGKVSLLVIAHGNSTATSMVDVATELLGSSPIWALNLPLDEAPERLIERVVETVHAIDSGKGVLLLVDMGSLSMMEKKVQERSKTKIKTIANVTTGMVLDAVRKVNYMEVDLERLHHSIKQDFFASLHLQHQAIEKEKVIVSICSSGKGTAQKIEKLMLTLLQEQTCEQINVLSISALESKKIAVQLQEQYTVLASVGIHRLDPEIPHISLEMLVEGSGETVIKQLIGTYDLAQGHSIKQHGLIKELCYETLQRHLVYLNPQHITELLIEWMEGLQLHYKQAFSNTFALKLLVHTAFAYERVVRKDPLVYRETWTCEQEAGSLALRKSLLFLEKGLDLYLDQDELIYIYDILTELHEIVY